jgi:threonine synthase
MWPWETEPHSLAHGILDDETYDWWAIAQGLRESGGWSQVAPEETVQRAFDLARKKTPIPVSATGSAGLAGLLAAGETSTGPALLLFSGIDRDGAGA